jgi:hypothetical protein
MTLLPRLSLMATLLAAASLHAEPMLFTPCSDTAVPGSLCSGLNVPGSYDAQGRAIGDTDAMHVFVRKITVPAGKPAKGSLWLVAGGPGEWGASFYSLLPTLRRSFPGFEFLIPDHRGTDLSQRSHVVNQVGMQVLAGCDADAACHVALGEPALRPGWTATDIDREEADLLFTSPLPRILLGCGLPTYPRDGYFGALPAKMPPTLVLQGTLDPKTPYAARGRKCRR